MVSMGWVIGGFIVFFILHTLNVLRIRMKMWKLEEENRKLREQLKYFMQW